MAIVECNGKPHQEELAKNGQSKHHRSIPELHKRDLVKALVIITIAETQMEETQFGAIPLIQRKDGNTVNLFQL